METAALIKKLHEGDIKSLARTISVVENEAEGYEELLAGLEIDHDIPVVGFTGPPGAGKSTLINALVSDVTATGKTVGIVAVDPTSPFNLGSLLGDRIRMSNHFENEQVFIRSLATRGSLGGLSAKTIEVVDVMRAFGFDYIFVETVGVGQSEIEIAGLADTTVLVLVPEAGDEIQTLKSGIMEIADIFVVNKSDRSGADDFARNLHSLIHNKEKKDWPVPVIKAVASKGEGCNELLTAITDHRGVAGNHDRKAWLLAEKAYRLIQNRRMKDVDKRDLQKKLETEMKQDGFNLYRFVEANYS